METRLVRQCTAEFRVEKGYPKWLPETDTEEEPVVGSRCKEYKHKNRQKTNYRQGQFSKGNIRAVSDHSVNWRSYRYEQYYR